MNDSHQGELPGASPLDWSIEATPETAVVKPGAKNGDDWVDWEQSTIKITLRGSLQSGYDLSDAITSAATFYSNLAVRDRRSNASVAKEHDELARRMSALAEGLEEHLTRALNTFDEAAASGSVASSTDSTS